MKYKKDSDMSEAVQQAFRQRSDAAVLQELEGWIRSGRLQQGHRLPSVKAIQKMLKVGQQSVESAKADLMRRGLIETRSRSGSYVQPNARKLLLAESEISLQSSRMRDYYFPPETLGRTLTVYTTDSIPRMRKAWQDALNEYQQSHSVEVKLLTPNDGHLMEVRKRYDLDVVHTTPEMLEAIGTQELCEWTSVTFLEDLSADLLPLVKLRMDRNLARRAAPFSVTVNYILVNKSLAERFGISSEVPGNPLTFLRMAKQAHGLLEGEGLRAFPLAGLWDLLMMTGGILAPRSGPLVFDRERTCECLSELHGCNFSVGNVFQIPNLFAAGLALYVRHCSFTCSELLDHAGFEWRAAPVPLAMGAQDEACLGVLAVPRGSQSSNEAFQLVEHLLSSKVQYRFAAVGGNLPVRQSALSALAEADLGHVSQETIQRTLAQSEIGLPYVLASQFERQAHGDFSELVAGRLSVGKLADRVQSIVERLVPPP